MKDINSEKRPLDDRDGFLKSLGKDPDNVETRMQFADWLEGRGEPRAAARQRWWATTRIRLWKNIQYDRCDYRKFGAALSSADDWRWRLGSLVAIYSAEHFHGTPPLERDSWAQEWPADEFLPLLYKSRDTIEAVALDALPSRELETARELASDGCAMARELIKACGQKMGPWMLACEVDHMANRTLAVATEWAEWSDELQSEGCIAGELMQATSSAFELLLAESLPDDVQ